MNDKIYFSENCIFNIPERMIIYNGREDALTPKQYKFLTVFVENSSIVLKFDQIVDAVWGLDSPYNEKQGISDLLHFFKKNYPEIRDCIRSIPGEGYKITLPKQSLISNPDPKEEQEESIPMWMGDLGDKIPKNHLSKEYRRISPVSNQYYCSRDYLTEAIDAAFKEADRLFLVGISGSGKSEASCYYGQLQLSQKKVKHVVPVALQENGGGDYKFLSKQIHLQNEEEKRGDTDSFTLLDQQDLLIIDNFNDVSNPTVFHLLARLSGVKVIITAQDYTEEMNEYGKVLFMDSVDNQNEEQKEAFSCHMFCQYSGTVYEKLSQEDKTACEEIISTVGFHALAVKLIALHYKRSGWTLQKYSQKIKKSIPDALKLGIKVSVNKDGKRISDTPYEILKHLFHAKLILRKYTEIERQVLGTIIRMEPYTNNMNVICKLTGDGQFTSDEVLVAARNVVFQLQEEGVIHIENHTVSLHPLIKAMVSDPSLASGAEETIAELSYDYFVHITKNLLEEWNNNRSDYYWTLWFFLILNQHILPHESERLMADPWKITEQTHLLANCSAENGDAVFLLSDSTKEYCLLDAGNQRLPEYRYYNKRQVYPETVYHKSEIIQCRVQEKQDLVIPDSIAGAPVLIIGEKTFEGQDNLQKIQLPKYLKSVEDEAFCNCFGLQAVRFPDTVQKIGAGAFYNCTSLRSVEWGKELEEIKENAFTGCKSLEGTLFLPDSLKCICRDAFSRCASIDSLVLPDSVSELGTYAFLYCVGLKEIKIGKGLSKLSRGVFRGCSKIHELVVPKNILLIEEDAFCKCTNLERVYMETGIQSIKNHAFYGCHNLAEIHLPASILSLDKAVFADCPVVHIKVVPDSLADKYLQRYAVDLNKQVCIEYD